MLADPTQAQVPILTIALDAGFQSIENGELIFGFGNGWLGKGSFR